MRKPDPGGPAEVEISVLPQLRQKSVGRALVRAVQERLKGRAETVQAETYSQAGVEFGSALSLADRARWIQTYTDLGNAPMLELNRAFGFRDADLLAILEGQIR